MAERRTVVTIAAPLPTTEGLAEITRLKLQKPLPETADEVREVARSVGADVQEMRI